MSTLIYDALLPHLGDKPAADLANLLVVGP